MTIRNLAMDFGYKLQDDMDIVQGFMEKSGAKTNRLSINESELVLNNFRGGIEVGGRFRHECLEPFARGVGHINTGVMEADISCVADE
jgi:hypothetical protein